MGRRRKDIAGKIFRFILSIVILSAFIIGIALFIKGLHSVDEKKVAKLSSKILSKANVNIDEEKLGDVAGKFIERISDTNISATSTSRLSEDVGTGDTSKLTLEIAIVADVQEDLASLERTLNKIKENNINKVIIIGDLTNYGELEDIQEIKTILDNSGLNYHVLPGDHDLAQSLSAENFTQVFGEENYIVDFDGSKVLFLNNSANFTPLAPSTLTWFDNEVKTVDFIVMSQPLFTEGLNLPFSKMYMGSTKDEVSEDQEENQNRVKAQRDELLSSVRDSQVSAIFAGDHHKSDKIQDAQREDLTHYTIGSISEEVNELPQRLIQSPRFSILKIYDNKSFKLDEILID